MVADLDALFLFFHADLSCGFIGSVTGYGKLFPYKVINPLLLGLMFEFQFQRATASTLSFVSVQSLGSILSPIMPGNVQPSRFKSILN